ncbi:Hypothetical predicted protein [Paramuricea clavata]|uniref:Uncharacterized protein n=1 Tax=Paramuricea clavata TaxID=317549 RepID=A0A6S7GCN8_PARCT|nr:Hypothetical predicted protein [Paramuricea clavata]
MDGYSCTIKITHNLVDRELVSPKVYLERGTTRTPPSYRIAAGYEDADKKIAIFDSDDKITKTDFVSSGSMSYDIGKSHLLIVVWNVVTHGTFLPGEGKNSFYFAVVKKKDIDWKTSLKTWYDYAQKQMNDASTTGRYVELINNASDASFNFTIHTHMTNDKNAQLSLIINDPRATSETTPTTRALATAIGMSALFTVMGSLSKMALRHLPTDTQSVVVTVQNDFVLTSLENPQWSLKQAIIFDSIPFEIPAQEERQMTFKVPFGYTGTKSIFGKTKHSAIFVSYRIKGTEQRLTFTIWWAKKLKLGSELNHYSVSLMRGSISPSLIQKILKNRGSTDGYVENVLAATQYLDYQCREDTFDIMQVVNGVQSKVEKIVRMAVTMGDSTASNMVVNIGERKGNKLDRKEPFFQACYEK